MSANLFLRLRQLLPVSPTFIGRVLAHNDTNDTSTIELPVGLASQAYAAGVTSGSTITARGRTVPVGSNAFVRDGIVQSMAPDAAVSEVVLGTVAPLPFGPDRLAAAGAVTLTGGTVGAAYGADLAAATTGGYAPRTYSVASGALPAGLALGPAGLTGTPTAAGVYSFTLTVTDTTRRSVTSGAVSLTIAA